MSVQSLPSDSDSNVPNEALEQAIVEFLRAQEEGIRLEVPSFLEKHSSVADELDSFIGRHMQLGRMMSNVREISETANVPTPTDFGDYEIIGEIGRGGMGVIYEARQKGLKRRVALKMIREKLFVTEESLIRFKAEAEAAAALEHPNIVPVYRVGSVDGHPFFTMKLIRGGSLKEGLADGPFTSKESARMACDIANAVYFAHQRGILHRDLKPANILLDVDSANHSSSVNPQRDAENPSDSRDRMSGSSSSGSHTGPSTPMISDFGLAKQLDQELTHGLTLTGAIIGTPSFMSPEQASGQVALTTSTDIYSVGAILFNMLTGKPPFEGSTPGEVTRKVIEQSPSMKRDSSSVDSDIKTICLKCLQKSPADRYATAGELADDLQRYISGKPITARRSGLLEQSVKWARRNPLLATMFSTVAALLILTLVGSVLFSVRLNNEITKRGQTLEKLQIQESETSAQRDQALRRLFESKFAEVAARRASGESGRRFGALEAAREAVAQLPHITVTDDEIFELRSETAGCLGNLDMVEVAQWDAPGYGAIDISPNFEMFVHHKARGEPLNIFSTEDLSRLGSIEKADAIASFDLGEKEQIGGPFRCRFSNCGTYLLAMCDDDQGTFTQTVFDIRNKRIVLREEGVIHACARVTAETKLIALADAKTIRIQRLPELEEVISFKNPSPRSNNRMNFSPDGKWLARFGSGGTFVFEVATGKIAWHLMDSGDLAWHPSEMEVAVCTGTEVQIWRIDRGSARKTASFPEHTYEVAQVEYTPDGSAIATSTWSNNTRFWDIQNGEQLFSIAGDIVRFSDDGSKVGFSGAQVGICNFESERLRKTISKPDPKHRASQPIDLDVHPNNRWVAMGENKGIRISDIRSGAQLIDLPGIGRVRFHPDGNSVFVGHHSVEKWPICEETLASGKQKLTIGPPQTILAKNAVIGLDIDADGKFIAILNKQKTIVVSLEDTDNVVEMQNAPRRHSWHRSEGVSISRGGRLVAVGNQHGTNAEVFDGATGELLHVVQTPGNARAKLSPDGDILVVTFDSTAEAYNTSNWKRIYTLRDTDFEVAWGAGFSSDGKYLLLTLRKPRGTLVIDAHSGEKLIRIPGAAGTAPRDVGLCLTSDQQLVSIKDGNSVEAWDLAKVRKQLAEIGLDWNDLSTNELTPTEPNDESKSILSAPEVEIIWGEDDRYTAYARTFRQVHRIFGKREADLTFEGWEKEFPNDPELWRARGQANYSLGFRSALEDWSKAMSLPDCGSDIYYLRGLAARKFNQRQTIVSDLTTYLDQDVGTDERRMVATQSLAWELGLNVYDLELSRANIEKALRQAKTYESWVSKKPFTSEWWSSKLPKEIPWRPLELTPERILANKTLALAELRNGNIESSIKLLQTIAPSETETYPDEALGVDFLLGLAFQANGKREKALRHYKIGLASTPRFQNMFAADAVDWLQLKSELERELDIEPEPDLRWTPVELASTASWDMGGLQVQFFSDYWRFTDVEEMAFERTNELAENLFWTPRIRNAQLTFNLEVAESGVYDGTLHLTRSYDYGKLEFFLNGKPVGTRFDGYAEQVILGDQVKLKGVKLERGNNELTLRNKASVGVYAGIELLEFKKR